MTAQDLKNSILQQAIQGKLVPQNPSDEPASELLKKIAEERQKLIDEGKIKNVPSLSPIEDDEKPFDIPDNWCWVRLNHIVYLSGGKNYTAKKSDLKNDIMYVKVSDMNLSENNPIICSSKNFLNQKDVGRNDFVLRYSIIFPKRGGAIFTNKRRKILTDNVVIDTNIMSMTPYIKEMIDYLYLWLQIMNLKKIYTGTSVPQINNQDIYPLLFPLPPLAEQKRIVAKLEELMPLIERYDAAEKKLSALDKEFPDKLRKSILQQAIQGKLTEQLSSDGDARDLLEKIRAEKAKLIAVSKIRKEKPLPPIKDDEKPFDIPDNWQWVRLSEIIYGVGSKSNQILAKEVKKIGKYPAISQGQQFIDGYTDLPDKLIYDVPLIMFGDHTRNVKYIDFPFVISADGTKFLKPILIEPKYFYWWTVLTANLLYNRGYNRHYKLLKLKLIPLPPLAEQKRIVAKLNELLPLCDALSEKIRYY